MMQWTRIFVRGIAAIALASALGGCVTAPYWTLTDKSNRSVKSTSFEFSVAEGWVRTTAPDTWERVDIDGSPRTILVESMVLTRDGLGIHAVSITRRYPDTAFPTLKKKSTAGMLPPEAADLYVAELRKRSGLERLEVQSNKPAVVDGKPGFQLVMQYKSEDGLRIRIVCHGFVDKTGLYTIAYRAPALHFFDRDHASYLALLKSFKQTKGAFEPPPEIPSWAKFFT